MQLRIPGPTPCPPQALEAMGRQMMNHRSEEFGEIVRSTTAKLQQVFQTRGDVFLLTASGTGGMEAAIVNSLSPGDKVLSISNGVFGERFGDIAQRYGAEVIRLSFDWGQPVDPDAVARALSTRGDIKAVLATHNETSTGVTNDLQEISAVVKKAEKLLLVDAISSLGCINLPTDDWNCDVVVTASQKGWMVPPGLAMVGVSEGAWQAHSQAEMPRYYWDFGKAKSFLDKSQTPWTPAVSIFYALNVTLDLMLEEGLNNIFARHARVGQIARDGIRALGLSLFADERCASNTVTAVRAPDEIAVPELVRILRQEHDVILSGGQGTLSSRLFRIGHLGLVYEDDIKAVLEALDKALTKLKKADRR
ncbi:MAG: pyridoxal-phosphate-dependent aminotransferase family protein [Dehalococcoidia bacterium]